MYEVLNYYKPKIEASDILRDLSLSPSNEFPDTSHYFLVSTHREENVDNPQNLENIINILNLWLKNTDYLLLFRPIPEQGRELKNFHIKN